jgi:hypothetical protein
MKQNNKPTPGMRLIKIADLAGKNVNALLVDLRLRDAQGSLLYTGHEDKPVLTHLRRVRFFTAATTEARRKVYGKDTLRYMEWASDHVCMAVIAENHEHERYYLMVEEAAPIPNH